jgi:glycerol-3-phosphate dehydrogenase
MAPEVATLMAAELGHDDAWQRREVEAFTQLASQYRLS